MSIFKRSTLFVVLLAITIIVLMIICFIPNSKRGIHTSVSLEAALKYPTDNVKRNIEILKAKVPSKGTVGMVLVCKENNRLYMLLSRERIGTSKEKAGYFSDFGGKTARKNSTVIENMRRELREETVGIIKLHPKEIINNGYTVFKFNNLRPIVYTTFLLPKCFNTNLLEEKIMDKRLPDSYREKDQFLWLNASQLVKDPQSEMMIKDNHHVVNKIRIKDFFLKDYLKNPEVKKIIKHLQKSSKITLL
jgi:hypothetical protein